MTKAFWIAALLASPAAAAAADSRCAHHAKDASAYPSFCGIPPTPLGVRDAAAFKAAVVDVRRAGRQVALQSAPETFGLVPGDTEGFDQAARAQAAYPTPAATGAIADTESFAAEARRLARPPARPRR